MSTEKSNQKDTSNELYTLLCPVFDDENEDEYISNEPDYYTCMCCGNVQERGMTCNKCSGPTTESFY